MPYSVVRLLIFWWLLEISVLMHVKILLCLWVRYLGVSLYLVQCSLRRTFAFESCAPHGGKRAVNAKKNVTFIIPRDKLIMTRKWHSGDSRGAQRVRCHPPSQSTVSTLTATYCLPYGSWRYYFCAQKVYRHPPLIAVYGVDAHNHSLFALWNMELFHLRAKNALLLCVTTYSINTHSDWVLSYGTRNYYSSAQKVHCYPVSQSTVWTLTATELLPYWTGNYYNYAQRFCL